MVPAKPASLALSAVASLVLLGGCSVMLLLTLCADLVNAWIDPRLRVA